MKSTSKIHCHYLLNHCIDCSSFIAFNNNNSDQTDGSDVKVYENRFIGRYDSLVYIDSDILPLQNADTYFYANETYLKNGNYIRVVKEQIQTGVNYNIFKESGTDAIYTFENQWLPSCVFYAANRL